LGEEFEDHGVLGAKERIRDACARITPVILKRLRHEWERFIRSAINVAVRI